MTEEAEMFNQRVLDYQDRRLDPPDDAVPCPGCASRRARERFIGGVWDSAVREVERDGAKDLLSAANLYAGMVGEMADWIEERVAEKVRIDGGRDCRRHELKPDAD